MGGAPAALRSLADASFVVASRCGEAGYSVADDGWGLWVGLAAASPSQPPQPAALRNRTAGWAWKWASVSAAPATTAFLYSADGQVLWAPNEPSGPVAPDVTDAACVHVTAAGALDDVPCYVTLDAVCCEVLLATPSRTATASMTPMMTRQTTPTSTHTSSMTPTSTMTPTASSTPSPTSTMTTTSSATAMPTPSQACRPDAFTSVGYYGLDGVVLGADSSATSLAACRHSCCYGVQGCTGFTLVMSYAAATPPSFDGGVSTCFLYANVTQLVPNAAMSSSLLVSSLPASSGGS